MTAILRFFLGIADKGDVIPQLLIVAALLLSGGVARAELPALFSPDAAPGTGALAYKQGSKLEDIKLGAIPGHYGMGMVFRGSLLPAPYSKDFENSRIIQIALGTLRGKLQGQVPQFASLTIIVDEIPKKRLKIPFSVPNGKGPRLKQMALLLFTAPATPAEQSDEEKLKGTYFAEGGSLTIVPVGKQKTVTTRAGGKSVEFRVQTMQVEIDAKLVTPFATEDTRLNGAIDFPVYWPYGKDAKALARRIATESLGTGSNAPPKEETGLTDHNPDVAGSTKKKKDKR